MSYARRVRHASRPSTSKCCSCRPASEPAWFSWRLLNAGVPVAGVSYEDKLRGTLEMFELGDYVVDIENPEAIPDLVHRAYEQRRQMRQTVVRLTPTVRSRVARAMDLAGQIASGAPARPNTPA
jgi:hypothetical protein